MTPTLAIPLACAGLFAASGCSVNGVGFVRSETETGDTYVAQTVTAFGLHLDTQDLDPSLTLGSYEAVRLYLTPCAGGPERRYGPDQLRMTYSEIVGAQAKFGPNELSVTLGYRALLLATPAQTDGISAIRFHPRASDSIEFHATKQKNCQPTEDMG